MFSQLRGFDCIRDAQSDQLPSERERELLERHRPVLYVGQGEEGPLDFYADYVSSGTLAVAGKEDNSSVDQAALNAVKLEPSATFSHERKSEQVSPVGYGSVHYGKADLPGLEPRRRDWTFLRYHFVFRSSGIAMGVEKWQARLMSIGGDLRDWHQLDHYTSVVVALDEADKPVAVVLQQHNYMHTYLVGGDSAFPHEGPFQVDAAIRSNELYPHRDKATVHRAASFISQDTSAWLVGLSDDRPSLGTYDHTSPDREVGYELKFLEPNDAFYVFVGRLGAKRRLPGRDGPPGAIYYTVPEIWEYEKSMPMFYWVDNDEEFARIYSVPIFMTHEGEWRKVTIEPAEGECLAAPGQVLAEQQRRLTEAFAKAGLVR